MITTTTETNNDISNKIKTIHITKMIIMIKTMTNCMIIPMTKIMTMNRLRRLIR